MLVACDLGTAASPDAPDASAPRPFMLTNPGESGQSKVLPKDPDTELVIGLDAEEFPDTQVFLSVKVGGFLAASETIDMKSGFPRTHETRVDAPMNGSEANVEIVVEATNGHGAIVTARSATTKFVKGKTKLIYLHLDLACGAILPAPVPACSVDQTCLRSGCISNVVTNLPDYHTDWATKPCVDADPTGTVAVGLGSTDFAPLLDGDDVTLECGPSGQGGGTHHLWMALESTRFWPGGTQIIFTATQPGTSVVTSIAVSPPWLADPNGTCVVVGMQLRFEPDRSKPLDIKVDTRDPSGRTASATRHVDIRGTKCGY